jgi:hypothetical protein
MRRGLNGERVPQIAERQKAIDAAPTGLWKMNQDETNLIAGKIRISW